MALTGSYRVEDDLLAQEEQNDNTMLFTWIGIGCGVLVCFVCFALLVLAYVKRQSHNAEVAMRRTATRRATRRDTRHENANNGSATSRRSRRATQRSRGVSGQAGAAFV